MDGVSVELGYTFSFADILDADTMECLRYNMNNQYTPGNGYDGHYWAGGYRGGDGQYRWDSGAVFEFDDFVGNPGEDPYIHLTPGNNYQWNTKNDQDDTNNGCLCKSQEEAHEVKRRGSICPVGWYSVGEKCIRWTFDNKLRWYEAFDYCQYIGAELVTWRSEGEYLTLKFFVLELNQVYPGYETVDSWTGANLPTWAPYNEFFFNNNTMDFVPMDYGWSANQPDCHDCWQDGRNSCVEIWGTGHGGDGMMNDDSCDGSQPSMCQALTIN